VIGSRKRRFDQCASTNDLAAAWARDPHDPAPDGGVIVADSQTAGRGRLGREWHSPAGKNLYFSCVLRPDLPATQVPPITLCAGLAVCEVVNSLGATASIKWPNDVWVGEKKLAGVLTEMSTRSQKVDSVIVGVGLNVNQTEFPPQLAATSLRLETGKEHERSGLLDAMLVAMEGWVNRYVVSGVPALARAFEEHSLLGGQEVRVRIAGEVIRGRVLRLADDGSLLIADRQGDEHKVIAGEVHLLSDLSDNSEGAKS
jgi:BirA family biotin operon repressor/biotin-[acetyl-CoA-carboxylase] ligase